MTYPDVKSAGIVNNGLAKIGKFRISEQIGKGAMGTVYLAFDPYMQRRVAIKVADPRSLTDEKIQRRLVELFFTEAKIYGMLDHRNILPVYDAGEDGNLYYLVMEYIEGSKSLQQYGRKSNLLPIPKVVEILFQCCKGLQYAHSRNVIHLDIKTSNIMLTPDDTVKIADFGLAKILHVDSDHLSLEHILGTPSHISPERLLRQPVNHQADIYSLGVVMYFLLTGHYPFSGPDLDTLLMRILKDDPLPLSRYRPEVPDHLEQIVRKAMARKLQDRYQGAGDMAADLNAFHKKIVHAVVTSDVSMREKLNRLTKLNFFKDFFEIEISEVVNACEWIEYEPGQMILDEKDLDESFYVIVDGEISVLAGGKVTAILGSGDCFGEMAYVAKRPRAVGIQAASDATILKISNQRFEKTSVFCQLKFTKMFLNTLIARLASVERRVIPCKP